MLTSFGRTTVILYAKGEALCGANANANTLHTPHDIKVNVRFRDLTIVDTTISER